LSDANILEEVVEDALVGGCEALDGFCWKLRMPWFTGVPDRLVILPGFIGFVELKRPKGGKLSKRQEIVHGQLACLGFPVKTLNTVELVAKYLCDYQRSQVI
jgi:hypothetical protein